MATDCAMASLPTNEVTMKEIGKNITAKRPHWKKTGSLKQRCVERGVDYWRALKRRQAGMTDEQIFAAGLLRCQRLGVVVTVNNVRYPNLEEAVRQLKPVAHCQTIARWMAAGMSPEDAFTRTPNPGYRDGIVYLIYHEGMGMGYVGVSVRSPERRVSDHLAAAVNGAIKHQGSLHSALREFGPESFTFTIIDRGTSLRDLGEKERLHIQNHQTLTPKGFNISPGGATGGSTPKPRVYKNVRYQSTRELVEHVMALKGISESAAQWRVRKDRIDAKATPKAGTGVCHTPAYSTWSRIVHGWTNPVSKSFHPGLEVFTGWRSFEGFLADVGQPPGEGYTLARRDKCLGYFPENCVWLSKSEASKLNAVHMKKMGTLVGNRRRPV